MNSVVPLAPKSTVPDGTDQLDKAGQTIQRLLHKAAGIAEENSRHAREMAQKTVPPTSSGRKSDC
jgi:hypothetical protein